MGNNGTIGNGTATAKLIADSFSVAIDPQVTNLQLWNVLLANLKGVDVVGSVKHDTYPQGFTGVVLLLDGHIAVQYGIQSANLGFDHIGELNILICTNGGPPLHEQLRVALADCFTDLLP
jgi:S-adenosylmethionine/arginine decarboxylase-like enzyme